MDEFRVFPDHPPRPCPPPLLSLLAAALIRLTGVSPPWMATVLPPLLGVLIFFPLFFLGRFLAGPLAGWIAGLIGVFSPYYAEYTGLGQFDTDGGNVIFTLLAICSAARIATQTGRTQYVYVAGHLVNFLAFAFWWDMAPQVVTSICLAALLLAGLSSVLSGKRDVAPHAVAVGAIFAWMMVWKHPSFWLQFPEAVWARLCHISKCGTADFPGLAATIVEQARLPFNEAVRLGAANRFIFGLAVLGLLRMLVVAPQKFVNLLVLLILGGFAFFFAQRFMS